MGKIFGFKRVTGKIFRTKELLGVARRKDERSRAIALRIAGAMVL
jgi:hypothetical protein